MKNSSLYSGPLIELKSVIFSKLINPGPGGKIRFTHQKILELYSCLYPVPGPKPQEFTVTYIYQHINSFQEAMIFYLPHLLFLLVENK